MVRKSNVVDGEGKMREKEDYSASANYPQGGINLTSHLQEPLFPHEQLLFEVERDDVKVSLILKIEKI